MRRAAPALVLAALVGTAACARLPATHFYVLEADDLAGERIGTTDDGARSGHSSGLSVGVEPFRVDPPYDQQQIVYRVGGRSAEVGFYAYHRWAAPLARLLPVTVAAALRGARGVGTIEPRVAAREYAATLSGRLLVLEEVDTTAGQTVRVRLLLRLRGTDGGKLWSRELAGEETTRAETVADVVARMGALLERLLAEARSDLERTLAAR